MKDLLTAKEVLARLLRSKEEQYGFVSSSSSRSFVLRSSSDSSCSPLLPPLLLSLSSLFPFLELSLPSPLSKNYFGNFVLSLSGPIGYSVLCLLRSRERLVILSFFSFLFFLFLPFACSRFSSYCYCCDCLLEFRFNLYFLLLLFLHKAFFFPWRFKSWYFFPSLFLPWLNNCLRSKQTNARLQNTSEC